MTAAERTLIKEALKYLEKFDVGFYDIYYAAAALRTALAVGAVDDELESQV